MAREKKITVKAFLNKQLKSVGVSTSDDRYYPIYFLVTYDRRVTKFPAPFDWHYWEDDEEGLAADERIGDMNERITGIIRHEINQSENFSITGIGKRLKIYHDRLFHLVDYVCAAYLRNLGFEVKSLPGRTPFAERLAAGILTVADTDKAAHELYYLGRFLEAQLRTINAFHWVLPASRSTIVDTIERSYYAGHDDDYEYSNRLTSGVRMVCSLDQLQKMLDKIVELSIANDFTLFTDSQVVIDGDPDKCNLSFRIK